MTKKLLNEIEHPFPNKELILLQKLHKEEVLSKEDIQAISDLLLKYLDLRAYIFHEI
jgi:hypothetical protein